MCFTIPVLLLVHNTLATTADVHSAHFHYSPRTLYSVYACICCCSYTVYREVAYREVKNAHRATQGLPPLPDEPTATANADTATSSSSDDAAAANAEVRVIPLLLLHIACGRYY